jgi:NAD(P)-dependent dehydrogenase (short-subunit alcohol dehydrogenase family)
MGFLKVPVCVVLFSVAIYFTKQYMNGGVCTSTERLDGKVVIVTGANTGIGKETAKDLVQRGAKVYMACRSLERAQPAVADIVGATGVSPSQLPIMHLDLASLQSIRDFAEEFKKKEKRLDILINNAGQMFVPESKTSDGFEMTFGVNHLGPFLLTNLLIDLMITGNSPSRIINVSSVGHRFGTINFDDLMMEKGYNSLTSYGQSKLANILFTTELARRLKGTQVTTYSLHPGNVRTELTRHLWFLTETVIGRAIVNYLSWPFLKEPWNGAQTSICCAVDASLATQSGKYYSDCAETQPAAEASDDDVAERLWDVSVDLVKLTPSEIHPQLRHHVADS